MHAGLVAPELGQAPQIAQQPLAIDRRNGWSPLLAPAQRLRW
jgi:hypothetical protein